MYLVWQSLVTSSQTSITALFVNMVFSDEDIDYNKTFISLEGI